MATLRILVCSSMVSTICSTRVLEFEGKGHVLAGHALYCLLGLVYRCLHALHERADLLTELGGAAGQVAHFVRDHREATPLFAGSRRLDGGIERQQVGLLGDGADFGKDAPHFLGMLGDAIGHFHQLDAQLAVADHAIDDLRP